MFCHRLQSWQFKLARSGLVRSHDATQKMNARLIELYESIVQLAVFCILLLLGNSPFRMLQRDFFKETCLDLHLHPVAGGQEASSAQPCIG